MINESMDYFEDIANNIGIHIKIPHPGKMMKETSILTNGIVGVGFIVSGMVFKKVPLVLIGVLGIAGSVLVAFDE